MDVERRRVLKEQYKQMKTYMGIYRVRNTVNGKSMVGASRNLKNRWLTLRMQLEAGTSFNTALQQEWKRFGPDAFCYEVLEEKETDEVKDVPWELEQMLKAWMDRLQPYGDNGYHKEKPE